VAALVPDLLSASRIEGAVRAAGGTWLRCDVVADLPDPALVDLLVVDWGYRSVDWGAGITAWRAASSTEPPVLLFGPHSDLEAHAAANAAGLGPMRARSSFFAALPKLVSPSE